MTSINGRPTPATGDYRIEFEAGRIGGRFGCNSWGGRYSAQGETLVAREVIATQMACGDPAGTFERQGLGILNQPMRWTWIAGRKLTLRNGAGSIGLERLSP